MTITNIKERLERAPISEGFVDKVDKVEKFVRHMNPLNPWGLTEKLFNKTKLESLPNPSGKSKLESLPNPSGKSKPESLPNPSSVEDKSFKFTPTHALGGAALATGLGLAAHGAYKKWKKKKERERYGY